jgi:4-coumarate--CoA ligase
MDDEAGELPRAYVVLNSTEESSEAQDKDIYEWMKEKVAPYKRLSGGIISTEAMPKAASGKILRRFLRDQVKAEVEQEHSSSFHLED